MDNFKSNILVAFDKSTGKFIRKIGGQGQGPGEYLRISDFCVDPVSKHIFLLDNSKACKVLKYGTDGQFIEKFSLNTKYRYNNIALSDNKLYFDISPWEYNSPKEPIKSNMLMQVNLETGETKEFLDSDIYSVSWNNNSCITVFNVFASKNESPKFISYLMNTVVTIDENGVYDYVRLNTESWISKGDFMDKGEREKSEEDQFVKLIFSNKSKNISNYIENSNSIFFTFENEDKSMEIGRAHV